MIRLGIAAESPVDAQLVSGLTDRVAMARVDWITLEVIDVYRAWIGAEGRDYLDIHHAYDRARVRKLRIYGHFNDEPGTDDAAMIRAALLLFAEEENQPTAVVIARDIDDHPERTVGFQQAARSRDWPFSVVGALAHPEIEAWKVAACSPEREAEHAVHHEVRHRLGTDPTLHPESLTSKNETDKRDAKRVLRELTSVGRTAEERWSNAPLPLLQERGASCGLTAFIKDVERELVPRLIGARS